jgi:hypothetical protein
MTVHMGMALPGYRPENADGIIERSRGCRSDKAQDQIDGRNTRFTVPPADISDPFEGELPTHAQSAPAFQRLSGYGLHRARWRGRCPRLMRSHRLISILD